mmetsp:Transcript_16278/g.40166  ORF Transcript_16278/g.40166 Transcript_16278/m.40166 type:complete len:231 (+) Transcript_16278:606-1298(+)
MARSSMASRFRTRSLSSSFSVSAFPSCRSYSSADFRSLSISSATASAPRYFSFSAIFFSRFPTCAFNSPSCFPFFRNSSCCGRETAASHCRFSRSVRSCTTTSTAAFRSEPNVARRRAILQARSWSAGAAPPPEDEAAVPTSKRLYPRNSPEWTKHTSSVSATSSSKSGSSSFASALATPISRPPTYPSIARKAAPVAGWCCCASSSSSIFVEPPFRCSTLAASRRSSSG